MAKKSAQGSSRKTSAARKTAETNRPTVRPAARSVRQPGDERTIAEREAESMAPVAPWNDGESLADRNKRLEQHRAQAAKRVQKASTMVEVAAPGKVHQPVKESGAGTPSADARPGRSSFTGPLEDDIDTVNERITRMQKNSIKVQATQTGYYDNIRRRPGEVFFIHADGGYDSEGKLNTAEKAFSPRWMRRVSDKTKLTGTKGPNQIIRERHDEILGARVTGRETAVNEGDVEDENPLEAD